MSRTGYSVAEAIEHREKQDLLCDLARVKAVFQLRTIEMHLRGPLVDEARGHGGEVGK